MRAFTTASVIAVAVAVYAPAGAQGPGDTSGAPAAPSWPQSVPFEQQVTATPVTVVVSAAGVEKAGGVPLFQVDPFWPKPLPNNWILGQVSGVFADKRNHIWVVHRPGTLTEREVGAQQNPPYGKCCYAAPPVLVFDESGNLLRSWGGPGQGYDWPTGEHGISVDDNDFVWLAGNGPKDGRVLKFTRDGKFVMQIGNSSSIGSSNDTTTLGRPADVAVDVAATEVYVADGYGNRRIAVFDSETGAYKRHWGAYGNRPHDDKLPAYDPAQPPSAQFGSPVHCVRLSNEGLVYVCDRVNNRMQIFRKDGTFVSEHVFERNTRLNGSVSDLVFSPDPAQNFIYMVDGVNNELRIVDRQSNEVLARVGRPGRYAGQFHVVHNVTADQQGNIYTAEVNTGQRVQKFRRMDAQN